MEHGLSVEKHERVLGRLDLPQGFLEPSRFDNGAESRFPCHEREDVLGALRTDHDSDDVSLAEQV